MAAVTLPPQEYLDDARALCGGDGANDAEVWASALALMAADLWEAGEEAAAMALLTEAVEYADRHRVFQPS